MKIFAITDAEQAVLIISGLVLLTLSLIARIAVGLFGKIFQRRQKRKQDEKDYGPLK